MTYELKNEKIVNPVFDFKEWDGHADYIKFYNFDNLRPLHDKDALLCVMKYKKAYCKMIISQTVLKHLDKGVVIKLIDDDYERFVEKYPQD